MSNPFPGVNPFIEAGGRWTGFHNLLIARCSELLNELLPPHYAAFVEERLELVESPGARSQGTRPDLTVVRDGNFPPEPSSSIGVLTDIEPALLTLPDLDETPEAFIDVRSLPEHEVVTSIEILSSSNKSPGGRGEYWSKRAAMLRQGVHLVEIDLLLAGRRLDVLEALPAGDFFAFVSRSDRRPRCDVYAWSMRRKLPLIPIPLNAPDPDVRLDLSTAFQTTFDRNRYDRTLRYDVPLPESVNEGDRHWVQERTRSVGLA